MVEPGSRCLGGLVFRACGGPGDHVDTGVDRHVRGVEGHVVEHRVAVVDVKQVLHPPRICGVVAPHLLFRDLDIGDPHAFHDAAGALGQRGADPGADDMGDLAQHVGCAPAADQDVAPPRDVEDLLRGVEGHVVLVDPPTFEQARFTFQEPVHRAFLHVHLLGDVLHQFVLDQIEPEPIGKPQGHVAPERSHLPRHRDDGHRIPPTSVPVMIVIHCGMNLD